MSVGQKFNNKKNQIQEKKNNQKPCGYSYDNLPCQISDKKRNLHPCDPLMIFDFILSESKNDVNFDPCLLLDCTSKLG